jgi:hypothetical protein
VGRGYANFLELRNHEVRRTLISSSSPTECPQQPEPSLSALLSLSLSGVGLCPLRQMQAEGERTQPAQTNVCSGVVVL